MNPSILVVDDDQEFLHLMHAILQRLDVRVEYAASGREALAKIAVGDFDVILLDLVMPDIDGLEVIRRMSASRPSLVARTIMVTAACSDSLRELDSRPVYAVMRKPFDLDQLVHMIGSCAGERPGHERGLAGPFHIVSHLHALALPKPVFR
ncbi:MAG TPA: response regulator [Thermoanaerobaculia bacterium]|nr:response regulator [Thermoanaerobaculia bacterium]